MPTTAGVALAVVSGVLGWVAPVPLLVAALRGPREALWLGAIGGGIAGLAATRSMIPVIPLGTIAGAVVARVVLTGAVLAATVALARRTSLGWMGWILAAMLVLGEWAGEVSGVGLWFTVGATQASVDWLRATAAVGGAYLVSFLVALGSGTLAVLVAGPWRARVTAATTAAALLGVAALAGRFAAPTPTRAVRAAAVVHPLPAAVADRWDRRQVESGETWEVVAAYEALTRRAAAAGAVVVVWPEYAVVVRDADLPRWQDRVRLLAGDTRAVVVAGYIDVDHGWNRALLASPDGDIDVYTKQALIAGVEDRWLHPGSDPFGRVEGAGLRVAARICYDAEFTGGWRAAGRTGVDLFALPSRDWHAIEERHAMQAVFRGAENGAAMVRATRDGLSLLVDPGGRVLARESSVGGREVLLVGEVPVAHAGTPYSRLGNWVVAASAVALIAATVSALRGRRRFERESIVLGTRR